MELTRIGANHIHDRTWFVGSAPSFVALYNAPSPGPGAHFVLFIAADCNGVAEEELVAAGTTLISRGASYVCLWGPMARHLECAFDLAADRLIKAGELHYGEHDVIMTISDEDCALEKALWFAAISAWPTTQFDQTTNALVAIAVGNDQWREQIATYLAAGAPMQAEA